jgi:serine phosphatase RsbU (regulator of sigma subunit)
LCSQHLEIANDGHFSTALVGIGDLATRRITIANAGHLSPLIVGRRHAEFVHTPAGLPIGVAPTDYDKVAITIDPGSTFLAYTDGLVERRGESIDDGLARLAQAAGPFSGDLEDMLTTLLADLSHAGNDDDIAVLAFRWPAVGDELVGR